MYRKNDLMKFYDQVARQDVLHFGLTSFSNRWRVLGSPLQKITKLVSEALQSISFHVHLRT